MTNRALYFGIFFILIIAAACSKESGETGNTAKGPDPDRGRRVYMASCIACHSPDPSKVGPTGPPIKGSSQELLEAKVLRGRYPEGYKPQRNTSIMPTQPHLKSAIPDLAAYLQ